MEFFDIDRGKESCIPMPSDDPGYLNPNPKGFG